MKYKDIFFGGKLFVFSAIVLMNVFEISAQVKISSQKPSIFKPDTSEHGRVSFNDASIALVNNRINNKFGSAQGTIGVFAKNSPTEIRGVQQSFKWNSNAIFTGMGFLVSRYGTSYAKDQSFVIDIQELKSEKEPSAVRLFKSFSVIIPATAVKGDFYLKFLFDEPLLLSNGKFYGINIYPATASDQHIYFERSNSPYLGQGGQSLGGRAISFDNGAMGFDMNFFLLGK